MEEEEKLKDPVSLVRKLSVFSKYPFHEEGEETMVDVLYRSTGGSKAWAEAVIQELIENCDECPDIAGIRNAALNLKPRFAPSSAHGFCRECGDTGWVILEKYGVSGARRCDCGHEGPPPLPQRKMRREEWIAWYGGVAETSKTVVGSLNQQRQAKAIAPSGGATRKQSILEWHQSGRVPIGMLREAAKEFPELLTDPDLAFLNESAV